RNYRGDPKIGKRRQCHQTPRGERIEAVLVNPAEVAAQFHGVGAAHPAQAIAHAPRARLAPLSVAVKQRQASKARDVRQGEVPGSSVLIRSSDSQRAQTAAVEWLGVLVETDLRLVHQS